ncbi:MAG: 3-hydroxyacyl-CoA dehydrogenase NAD-binding domain-containing protein [Hyphomonadaceae bacterium]
MENFKIDVDGDGIALITFDVPGRSMNTITAGVIREVAEIAERVKTDAAIKGVVLASGKASGFCAGADLGELESGALAGAGAAGLQGAFDAAFALSKSLRALETCGKPVACALEGLALGGGLEIALACHYRVVADDPKIQLGLPEAKVGLMPGGGGTQRLPRLVGAQAALLMMSQGDSKKPQEAKAMGFVQEVVAPGQTVAAARAWAKANPGAKAAWDDKGYRLPGGGPYTPGGFMTFIGANALLSKQTYGNYPQQTNLLKAVYEGIQVPIDAGLRIEARYFVRTLQSPTAKGMMRTLFLSMQELGKGANRPQGFAKYEVKKAAVLGAGMMGAGIAYVQALAGIETVLIDVSQEAAEKGKAHAKDLLERQVSRGRMDRARADGVLALIHPTNDYAAVKSSDIVIEAVFEKSELKAEVTKKAEAQLAESAVFGSNTSTLPITGLAKASVRPANFVGVHFFSPVDRMGLVEIIVGKETSRETIAKVIDYVLKIRKTPIVVQDSRGFYTSRVFSTYISEGLEMLGEGIKPAIIENVGRFTGMPRGPLEMYDDVALDLGHKIMLETKAALGAAYKPTAGDRILGEMVEKLGRYGRKNAKGFYEYPADGGKKTLWPGLSDVAPVTVSECPPPLREELKRRLLYRQAVETARCFEEGVITEPRDADVGSILGWGFAPYTGGVVSLMDAVGLPSLVAALDAMAQKYGPRFAPNALLREMAAKNETFYGRFGAAQKKAA